MKQAGTWIFLPAWRARSSLNCPVVRHRYHCSAAWKPLRSNASAYTASSSPVSQRQAAIASAEGNSGETVSAIVLPRSMM